MDASCPCHRVWHSATAYYDHLQAAHAVPRDQAFLLSQLALLDYPIEFVVDVDGDVILCGVQLPLGGL